MRDCDDGRAQIAHFRRRRAYRARALHPEREQGRERGRRPRMGPGYHRKQKRFCDWISVMVKNFFQTWICGMANVPTLKKRHVAIARLKHNTNLGTNAQEARLKNCPSSIDEDDFPRACLPGSFFWFSVRRTSSRRNPPRRPGGPSPLCSPMLAFGTIWNK